MQARILQVSHKQYADSRQTAWKDSLCLSAVPENKMPLLQRLANTMANAKLSVMDCPERSMLMWICQVVQTASLGWSVVAPHLQR